MPSIKILDNVIKPEFMWKFESILNAIKFKKLSSTKEELVGILSKRQDEVIFDFNDPELIAAYNERLWIMIEEKFWVKPNFEDKRLSEAAKQI